jgi:type II secretory pathway pseudopilin PulG
MMRARITRRRRASAQTGFSLAEVVVTIGIVALVIGSLINGYLISAKRAEWTSLSEAAQSLTVRRMEQVRAARWDVTANPPMDELVQDNFPPVVQPVRTVLCGTNETMCTNITTIRLIGTDPPLKMIRTDCYWQYMNGRIYTNRGCSESHFVKCGFVGEFA